MEKLKTLKRFVKGVKYEINEGEILVQNITADEKYYLCILLKGLSSEKPRGVLTSHLSICLVLGSGRVAMVLPGMLPPS